MSLKNPRDRVGSRGDLNPSSVFEDFPKYAQKGNRRRMVMVTLLVICAVVAVLVTVDYWRHYGKIYSGVEVGGTNLGDKTPEEARAMLEKSTGGLKEIRFTGPETFTLSADKLGVGYDVRSTVDQAYAVGRQGGILARISDRIGATWGEVSVSAVADYKQDVARNYIKNLAARENTKPKDAYVAINGSRADVVDSSEGYAVDVDATMANVDQALKNVSGEAEIAGKTLEPQVSTSAAEEAAQEAQQAMSGPMILTAGNKQWKISPEVIGQTLSFTPKNSKIQVGLDQEQLKNALSDVYKDLEVEPVEAGFKFNDTQGGTDISVTQSQTGKKIDEEKLFDAIESGLFQGQRNYDVPVVTTQPKLTTEQAEKIKPTALIGSYRTNYTLTTDQSPERVENLRIASNAITGTLLAPDDVFSVNDVASPLHYNETHVIIQGKEEKADGGGLCQVASTLYNAVNYAGLDVLERHPHDSQLPYIRPGLDATVWFGALDMKFQNTSDNYILLREYVSDDGYIYAQVFGQPTGKKVEMDSQPEYLGSDYSKWTTTQKVTDDKGKVLFDDVIHKDTYKPLIDEHGQVIPPNYPYLNIAPVIY